MATLADGGAPCSGVVLKQPEGVGCFELGRDGWLAAVAVSGADISMNVAFKWLGANAYSFVRAGSLLLSGLLAVVQLGHAHADPVKSADIILASFRLRHRPV